MILSCWKYHGYEQLWWEFPYQSTVADIRSPAKQRDRRFSISKVSLFVTDGDRGMAITTFAVD
jgi:hypothetical protein